MAIPHNWQPRDLNDDAKVLAWLRELEDHIQGQSYTPDSFGAARDGVTDDTNAVQKAVTTVVNAGGGEIVFQRGTYKINSPITGIGSFVRLRFEPGSTIDASGLAAANQLFSTTGGSGDTGSVALTGDAATGATTFSIAAGQETNFAVGGYVKIGSQKQWSADTAQADASMDGWRGEIGIVSSTGSGSVTVAWPTFDAYAVSDSAFIAPMTMLEGIAIIGPGKIIGPAAGKCRAFKLDRTLHLRVRDVTFTNWDDAALQLKDPYDAVIDGVSVIGGASAQTSFYGVTWQFAAQWCTMTNCTFKDVRHSATTDQINLVRSGIPRFITYKNCKAFNTTAASFDAHAYGEHIVIEGCESYNAFDHGVSLRCPSGVVKDCVIVNPGTYGIYLRNQTSQPSRYTVEGNQIIGSGSNGINWRTPSEAALAGTQAGTTVDGVTISGNLIKNAGAEGIIVQSASGFNNIAGGVIQGNVIKYASATQTAISLVRATDMIVRGNLCTTAATGLAVDNNSDHCLIAANNFRGCTTPLSLGTGAGHIVETTVGSNQSVAPPLTVARTADSTASTNNTLADDDTLLFSVSGNSADVWFVEYFLMFNAANATMDGQVSLSAPSGTTGIWGYGAEISNLGGFAAVSTATTPATLTTSLTGSSTLTFGTPVGLTAIQVYALVVVGNTSGNFKLRWAENTTDAGGLVLKKGSFLRATKLA